MAFKVKKDCIHIEACRRVQAIGRKFKLNIPCYCTEDCTAYYSGDTVIHVATKEELQDAINWAVDEIKNGMDYVRVGDLQGHTLNEIINEMT